ncbi:MAG: hypothetical protein ACI4QN_00095 [Candidatus Coproplasma sp.]
MKLLQAISNMFSFWIRIEGKYSRIKNDEEKRDISVKLGVRSIVETIYSGILVILLLLGLYFCVNNLLNTRVGDGTYSMPLLTIIGIIVCGVGALICLFQGMGGSLLYMVYQFKLNKKPVRWVALALWLAMIVAIIVFAIIVFLQLK